MAYFNRSLLLIIAGLSLANVIDCSCVKCQNNNFTEDELREMDEYHLELIKSRILANLNLQTPPEPPTDLSRRSFPNRSVHDDHEDDARQYKTIDLRLLAKTNHDALDSDDVSLCNLSYKFSTQSLPYSYRILRVRLELPTSLWSHTRHITLDGLGDREIGLNATDVRLSTVVVDGHEDTDQDQYYVVQVDTAATRHLHQHYDHHHQQQVTLRVRLPKTMCQQFKDTANKTNAKPLLELKIKWRLNRHGKRAVGSSSIPDCESMWDSNLQAPFNIRRDLMPCCRRKQVVHLATIGWSHWVIAPKSFVSYYCLGRCSKFGGFASEGTEGATFYTHTMNGLTDENRLNMKLVPCCAPVKFSGLTMTTRTKDDEEMTQTLPDVIATQCGCM